MSHLFSFIELAEQGDGSNRMTSVLGGDCVVIQQVIFREFGNSWGEKDLTSRWTQEDQELKHHVNHIFMHTNRRRSMHTDVPWTESKQRETLVCTFSYAHITVVNYLQMCMRVTQLYHNLGVGENIDQGCQSDQWKGRVAAGSHSNHVWLQKHPVTPIL